MQPDQTLSTNPTLVPPATQVSAVPASRSIASGPLLGVLVVVGLLFFAALTYLFPVVTPSEEQLKPFPPEEVAVAREGAFALGRWLNPLIALSACAFVLSVLLAAMAQSNQASKPGASKIVAWSLLAAVVTSLGVTLAWLFTEFVPLPQDYAMLKTIVGHFFEVAFFAAAVAMAVGAFDGGSASAFDNASRGFLIGLIAAILYDLLAILMPRMQIDNLFPGGVIWGDRDPMALALWIGVLFLSVMLTLLGVGGKKKVAVA